MDHEEIFEDLGRRLRSLRRSRGISQRHLAEIAGVSQSFICRLERDGDERWTALQRLFSALGHDVALLPQEYGEDDLENFLRDGIRRRKDRMEEGRRARWG